MDDPEGKGFFLTFVTDPSAFGDEFIVTRPKIAKGSHWEPRLDVIEEPTRILIKVELAGVHSHEISLVYVPEKNILKIRGSRHEDCPEPHRIAHQLEISYGIFAREVSLPEVELDGESISAHYRNGFLHVSIPKI